MNRIEIEITEGGRRGYRQAFERARILLGRREDCDLRLDTKDDKTSGRHAEIVQQGEQVVLRDLKSTNGTFVGAVRVLADYPLKSGDSVQLGKNGPVLCVTWDVAPATSTQAVSLDGLALEGGGKTAFYKAMMVDTVEKSGARLRYVVGGLVAALVTVVVVLVIVLGRQQSDTAAIKATADAALSSQDAAQRIATANERAIFMLIARTGETLEGYCTAFAVGAEGVLATNAHCIRALESYRDKGSATIARMNRHPEVTYPVADWKIHPDYTGDPRSPDVALLRLETKGARLSTVAELADAAAARALTAGQHVYTLGFPGQVMNESDPAADLRATEISRLTDFQNTPGDPKTAQMVWHSALTSKGTSGSPLFDTSGKVVAVNNGGLSAKTVTIADPKTGTLKTEVTYEATGLNFGIRVDVLQSLFSAK